MVKSASRKRAPPLSAGPGIFEAVLTLVGLVAVEYALTRFLPSGGSPWSAASLYRVAVVRALEIALLAAWWRLRGLGFSAFGFDSSGAPKGIAVGLLLSAVLGGFAFSAEAFWRWMGWGSFLRLVSGPRVEAYGALVLAAVVVGPLFEELVFRGLAYGALRRRWGVLPSLAVATAAFAAAHLPGGRVPWIQALGGIVFCLGLEVTGSLWAPVVVHALGNLVLFSLPYFAGRYF